MTAEAKNLKAISKALDSHADRCDGNVIEIRMAPYEVERLDWREIRGVPIRPDEKMGTGRLRLICDAEHAPTSPIRVGKKVAA
jgi:hypothetical protein